MSRATKLAAKCGAVVGRSFLDCSVLVFKLTQGELEAFYHAARSEALREAAKECDARLDPEFPTELDIFSTFLRAMADREGK